MSIDAIARKHIARAKRAQSFTAVHAIYLAARKAVGPLPGSNGTENERLAARSRHGRKVSVEFHRRLRKAGIRVEGVR